MSIVKLSDITKVITRGVTPKYVEAEGIPVINQKCIRNYVYNPSLSKLTNKKTKISTAKFVQPGDVLVNSTGTGTLGRTAYIKNLDAPTTVDTHVTIVRPDGEVCPRYLGWFLAFAEPWIELLGKGATNQIELSREDLGRLKVRLPSPKIQNKIAKILSSYDDLIENNTNRIDLLKELSQITYEEWFVRSNQACDWQMKKLGEIVDYIKRGISPKYVEEDGVVVLNQKCIRENCLDFSVARLTSREKKISAEKYLYDGDILVNSTGTGTLGRVAQYFGSDKVCTVDSHVTIVRANKEFISPYILGRFLEHIEPFIENLGKGATNQQELSASDMCVAIKMHVPPKELQNKYEALAKPIYAEIGNLQRQNVLLKEARDILLPRLMTGMIDVENYNPALLLKEAA